MTKKDYKLIAEILKTHRINFQSDGEYYNELVKNLGLAFQTDNPRFNPEKFRQAIYGDKN